jgi:hypothetical protein
MTDRSQLPLRRRNTLLRLMVQVLGVLLMALVAWSAWLLTTARIQHDAVAAIEKAGGSVSYDWELRDRRLVPTPKPPWLKWLVDHLGVDCFCTVTSVELGRRGGDPELAQAARLPMVEALDARTSSVTDAGLVHLKRLKRLRELRLDSTAITDAGLVHLQDLTTLRYLDLSATRVTDAGLPFLKRLSQLEDLGLWKANVSRAGAQALRNALPRTRREN